MAPFGVMQLSVSSSVCSRLAIKVRCVHAMNSTVSKNKSPFEKVRLIIDSAALKDKTGTLCGFVTLIQAYS